MSDSIDALFSSEPFPRRKSGLFISALRECARVQARRFPVLARLNKREGFGPARLRTEADLRRLPFLHVSVFKEHQFKAAGGLKIALTLTSSGTSGQKSQNRLDAGSLRRVKECARRVYAALGMAAPEETANYVCLTYDPREAKDLGTAFTDELLTSFTRRGEVFYAIRRRAGGAFAFDLEGTLEALRRFSAAGLPVRVLGFPAHLYFALEAWRRRAWPRLGLGPRSWALTGGGWKSHEGASIPKERFKAEVSDWLGFPAANIRDLYGLVEHGIPYVECRLGRMHVPGYARVIVRHPATLEPLPYGRVGLPQLITPYLTSYPSFSILAGDWASLAPRCSCGTAGETLSLHGRAGRAPAKGCAVTAAELLAKAAS